jgi:hypothetical protein
MEEGELHRDMTSETLRVLRELLPQRHLSMNKVIECCSSRGWSLMLLRDSSGMVQRGIAMRAETVRAVIRQQATQLMQSPMAAPLSQIPGTEEAYSERWNMQAVERKCWAGLA